MSEIFTPVFPLETKHKQEKLLIFLGEYRAMLIQQIYEGATRYEKSLEEVDEFIKLLQPGYFYDAGAIEARGAK